MDQDLMTGDFEGLLDALDLNAEDFELLGLDDPELLQGMIAHTYGKGMIRHLTEEEDEKDAAQSISIQGGIDG